MNTPPTENKQVDASLNIVSKRPRETDDEILNFFLHQFKCQPCQFKKGRCEDKSTCEGWHHEGERRRDPGTIPDFLYTEEPCPRVKPLTTSKWGKPTICKVGDTCPFSHTLMEQMYHPNIYKTSLCTNFASSNGDQCQWGYFCTHAHGTKDIRNVPKTNNTKRSANNRQKQPTGKHNDTKTGEISEINKDDSSDKTQQKVASSSKNNGNQGNSLSSQQNPLSGQSRNSSTKYSSVSPNVIRNHSARFSRPFSPTTSNQFHTHGRNYDASQTFPNRSQNDKQKQPSWDITSNGSSNNISNSQASNYTGANNVECSPPPLFVGTSYDFYHDNMNNANNMSPTYTSDSHSHVGQPYTSSVSTITNSPSQKPNQLPRPRSLNVLPLNSKLQVIIPSNPVHYNQFMSHTTPSYTMENSAKYNPTFQTYTPHSQTFNVETTNGLKEDNKSLNMWPTTVENNLNDTLDISALQPSQNTTFHQQENVKNVSNANHNTIKNFSSKDVNDNVSYYFLGDDSLLSPISQKTSSNLHTNQVQDEDIIKQLKSQINEIKKELQLEQEKNAILQASYQESKDSKWEMSQEMNDMNNEFKNGRTQQLINLFEKFMKCPSCNSHNKIRDNVLVPCGHVVCEECIPTKTGRCPICMQEVNKIPQKLNF